MVSNFVLFAQHGWADTNGAIASLAHTLVAADTPVIAPNLGWVNTWLRIDPLIQQVETAALAVIEQYPHHDWRVMGHSMGGVIWVELLHRHPEWWSRLHSLTLVGSPIGGADLGRLLAPFGLGMTVADDLGVNRRPLAEAIAAQIPTLVVASDIDGGSDGTVTLESTKVARAKTVVLSGVGHAKLKRHPQVGEAIAAFWKQPQILPPEPDTPSHRLIQRLRQVPGITDAHYRDAHKGSALVTLADNTVLCTWTNFVGVKHVFVVSTTGKCLYAGFVGWKHHSALEKALEEIVSIYGDRLTHR
ncbi:MAG: alpha/beta hydrolase [Cyanothece sp. SIO2G6]|nr:alpha/beta hydrolase [Cyanothece sp. SIO2G6]